MIKSPEGGQKKPILLRITNEKGREGCYIPLFVTTFRKQDTSPLRYISNRLMSHL